MSALCRTRCLNSLAVQHCRRSIFFSAARFSASTEPPQSIFSSKASTWDHVFNDVKDMPPLLPSKVRNPLRHNDKRPRRQAMTAREISAFEDMFDIIFNAVSKHESSKNTSDVNLGGMGDLFGRLRRHSKRLKWTTEADEKLDQQKEAIDLCDTDYQLLDWTMREVFGESERYERESRALMAEAARSGGPPKELPMLQPPTYPHLIALLMRKFRDKYNDPHLALAIFDHAKYLSIPSYVFGCSTAAYNELIDTRWRCFRDLKGVYDVLQEMTVNGVDFDSRTRKLVETVRRQVGERNLWVEEDALGSGEVWGMLSKIEKLVLRPEEATKDDDVSHELRWDEWKSFSLKDHESDAWGFDQWNRISR